MSIHFHAFLPPRKLMPLSDPETFKPREFGLHVIALPDESADRAKSADSAELAPPAGSAEPVEPIEFAEPAAPVESAAAAQSAHLAQPAQRKRPSQPSLDDSGSLPLRRSRRLQASGETQSQHASYSRLSSSLGSDFSLSQSRASGWPSSVSNLPRWTLPPFSRLTPLHELLKSRARTRRQVSLLCCVVAVTPPVARQRRRAPGGELWIASWKVLAPPERGQGDPASCAVTLFEGCAKDWGGEVRRGDVILLQDVDFVPGTPTQEAQLVLSPRTGLPRPTVLFRTLPRREAVAGDYVYKAGARGERKEGGEILPEDKALRPDLAVLARSDIGVRRVAEMAMWCAEWVGGEGPAG